MGVSSSESHDLTAFYEMLSASFGVLSQNTGFYPSLDRIIETTLGPLNLGPRGGSYNEPISRLHRSFFTSHLFFQTNIFPFQTLPHLFSVLQDTLAPPPPFWKPWPPHHIPLRNFLFGSPHALLHPGSPTAISPHIGMLFVVE